MNDTKDSKISQKGKTAGKYEISENIGCRLAGRKALGLRHKSLRKSILSVLLILAISLISLASIGCEMQKEHQIKDTIEAMDTFFTITIYSADEEKGNKAMERAFGEIRRIEAKFSAYDKRSDIYALNELGYIDDPDKELLDMIHLSKHYASISDGSFDITVQPVLDLYAESFSINKRPPTDDEISKRMRLIGHAMINASKDRIQLEKEGMKITLGGIAKGYAADKAAEILQKEGIESALVDAGGDLKALGKKPGNKGWSIALQNPRDTEEYIEAIVLFGNAVATSGDYERYYDEDMSAHHILDPKTGKSASGLISATVIAKNATEADALATAVFVLGEKKGLELIESLQETETIIITDDRKIYRSSGI